jgi:hypothetical protein
VNRKKTLRNTIWKLLTQQIWPVGIAYIDARCIVAPIYRRRQYRSVSSYNAAIHLLLLGDEDQVKKKKFHNLNNDLAVKSPNDEANKNNSKRADAASTSQRFAFIHEDIAY